MFSISIQVTFDIEFDETTSQIILKGLSIITFFLDFFIKLKTSFYKHGSLIKSHKTIRDHYIKESFLIDFLSFCALVFNFFIYANSSIRWISLIFFAHVKTIKKIMINFENIIDFGDFYDLFVVMFKLLFIAHLYACMWHYIGYSQGEKTDHTWLKLMNIENSKWYIRYIYSIYWALTTMVTVGYGDIIPQNTYEVFFVSCAISSGSMVFGYCLNRIGSTLTKIDERDQELKFLISFEKNI